MWALQTGESPRGVSPRGARRTGQDTLASSGSHHGATLRANSQWANNSGQRREMLAIQCLALRVWVRSFLYLRLVQRTSSRSSWIVGRPDHAEHNEVAYRQVSPGYFTTL